MDYFDLATRIARANIVSSNEKNYLFGVVAKREDGAIATSSNVRTEHRSISAHAEARVLRKAGVGATLWLVRITRDGIWAMSKPCKLCQAYLSNRMVKRVYYSIGHNEYGVWKTN